MKIAQLYKYESNYPSALQDYLGDHAPESISSIGNLNLLSHKTLALFCSVRCPGSLILQTYDLAQQLRQVGITVIGGFHSPMERECLTILLRGIQPVIICPARSLRGMRIRKEYKKPLEEGRLLLLSPFADNQRRATLQMALYRNQLVAALADQIFVAYAEPHSKTDQFCRDIIEWQKPLYMLKSDANLSLIALGAKPVCLNLEP
jgi:predicted Rossmann fold nucleotide-binding protein DprA/Smf involved in DNA uptake